MTFLLTLIVSCGPRVTTKKPTNDNLSKYSTFSYLPNAAIEMPDQAQNDNVNTLVIQQINERMMDEGYKLDRSGTETDTDPVYARYGAYNRSGLRVNSYYNNFYYRGYNTVPTVVGYDTDTYNYKEGTLIVQLVERSSNETVWKGVSSTSVYDSGTTQAMTQLVNAIFDEYPLK